MITDMLHEMVEFVPDDWMADPQKAKPERIHTGIVRGITGKDTFHLLVEADYKGELQLFTRVSGKVRIVRE